MGHDMKKTILFLRPSLQISHCFIVQPQDNMPLGFMEVFWDKVYNNL